MDEKTSGYEDNHKYTGKELDEETNLYYYGARYYNGKIGRFISQDPTSLAIGDSTKLRELTKLELRQLLLDPQLLNYYIYARNNPLLYRDPDGNFLQAVAAVVFITFAIYTPQINSFFQSLTTPIGQYSLVQAGQDAQNNNYGMAAIGVVTAGEIPPAGKIVKIGDSVRDASKPIWSLGRYGDSIKNAFEHWNNHKSDFSQFRNAKEYVEGTYNFFKNYSADVLSGFRKNGDKLIYDVKNNILGIMDKNEVPKTMFKPDPSIHGYKTNLEYYYEQLKK